MAGKTTANTIDLSTDEGYSKAAAIRGPDFQVVTCLAIKHTYTARVRWLAGARNQVEYGTRNRRLTTSDVEGLREEYRQCVKASLTAALFHYLMHIESAASALGDKKLADLAKIFRVGGAGIEENVLSTERIIELAGGD